MPCPHVITLPTQQVLLQIFCTFARTRVPINYVRGLFLGHKDFLVTMVHAVFFVMMNCHLTAGADTPIIYTHGGLDVICIQTSTFSLPPSFLPLCSLSVPPPPPSSLQSSLNILQVHLQVSCLRTYCNVCCEPLVCVCVCVCVC